MSTADIDSTDRELIRQLQADGRATFSKLGGVVGLSDAATRQRVNRLIAEGVINVVAVTDPAKLGTGFQAMLGLCVSGDVRSVARSLDGIDDAVYVVITAGRYDLIVETVCKTIDDFVDVSNRIRTLDGVRSVDTMTYLDITKQTYDWGVGPAEKLPESAVCTVQECQA